jgi:hypothetical protein
MKKLTKEDILSFPITSFGRSIGKQLASQVVHELLGYKQLEEQLGCPLEVAVNALLNGVYESYIDYGDNNSIKIRHRKVRGIEIYGLSVINTLCCYPECDETFEYKDYKKTWFLKKDKSE